ncbi:hypothetical protein TWF696_001248 [Orbilia brochopaga]|uniref:Uncharacterized protein n=1 Tax=Orbilia brochopaga TaxID=3140254 RepID=A0AAV9U8W7_9PEZI
MHIYFFHTFLFIAAAAADLVHIGNPACDDIREYVQCLPRKLAKSPGIGIHLAAEYGTVSVSYHNGTTVDIARINSSLEFTSLMNIFALEGNCILPSARTPLDRLYQRLEHSRRERRKSVGQPASYESSVLAQMIGALRHEASIALNTRITHALVTHPPLPGLKYDDLLDAAFHEGITLLHGFSNGSHTAPKPDISTLLTAAYAGVGLGLCENYTDTAACRAEEHEMDTETSDSRRSINMLRVSLDARTLSIDVARCASAAACVGGKEGRDLHELGFHSDMHKWNPQQYWTTLQNHILEAGKQLESGGLDAVIVHGESARSPEFITKLVEVLPVLGASPTLTQSIMKDLEEDKWDCEPEFLAARGAAEMAKRVQAGQRLYDDQKACHRAKAKLKFEGVRMQQAASW